MRDDNEEQPFHPIYDYALITDSREGLLITNVNTLADRRASEQFPAACVDVESRRHSERRPPSLRSADTYAYITAPRRTPETNPKNRCRDRETSISRCNRA